MKQVAFGITVLAVLLAGASGASAQQDAADIVRKQAHAVRVAPGSVNIDGRLDDAAWSDAVPVTDFWQREPIEGGAPSDPIEVRLAYDDDALYVGARLFSSIPLQAPMGRRDEGEQSEYFSVMLDTYLDRRTAYEFGVTAAGVRLDWYYPRDNEREEDTSFDPVWQARTSRDAQGWTAELWIPFSQLRFTERSPQVWGLNMYRWVPSRNEEIHWQEIPRTDQRLASRFGDLHGIDGIRPSRRIELMPYVASSSHLIGVREEGDPFTSGANAAGRVGMDAKIGIGSNLTLEATVNPDFGQVEADPAEVNLSAFETFFSERRPFFVEGINLLQGPVNNFFYSRRIGASPVGDADADFVDFPAQSSILGAAKLTGRLESGLSIGMLGALTAEETARTFDFPNTFGRVRVAPQTTYGVTRLQQELGTEGSTAAVMITGMHRDLPAGDPIALLSTRNAFTVSGDSLLRLRDGDYELESYAGYSHVDGSAAAIDRVQRGSARYLQRPDADYVVYDPTRTALSGGKFGATFSRENARHWTWEIGTDIESPEFETNDIGRLNQGDGVVGQGQIQYEQTVPNRFLRDYSIFVDTRNEWNFGGDRQQAQLSPGARLTWPNFWETEISAEFNGRNQNQRLTRGGPLMQRPRGWNADIEVSNSEAAATRGQIGVGYGADEDGGLTFTLESEFNMQPAPQLQLSITPEYSREISTQQYVAALAGGPGATFGSRYVFARIDQSEYSTQFRMNYTFKPDLTLDFYGEPFSASGRYSHIGELVAARTRAIRLYGTDGTTITTLDDGSRRVTDGAQAFTLRNRDFNVQSFRSNLVLRWEWRAGSTLYLVWQQDRESEIFAPFRTTPGDMFGSLGQDGDNFFAVKITYWFSPS
jgi:hypothetical protein